MKVAELFIDLNVEIHRDRGESLTHITSNSKEVKPHTLFIAKDGASYRGSDFIDEAVAKGAEAVLFKGPYRAGLEITQIICSDPQAIEPFLADRFYEHPSTRLHVIGLTGTNGKTSTSYLIRQLMGESDFGLIGTIEYITGPQQHVDATLTTPDVVSNQKMLSQMIKAGLSGVVMEATSIALTQNRLTTIDFDVALFTNFSQDHLDYHETMEKYLDAKSLLFERLDPSKVAIFNLDDPASHLLISRCPASIITYGVSKGADYHLSNIELKNDRSLFTIKHKEWTQAFDVPLIGKYNVYNTVAAIAVAHQSGVHIHDLLCRVQSLKPPKGRLERIENPFGAQIFVDFAHTEDALKNVIEALLQTKPKRLVTVFGCGGDRDPHKRPSMGQTVSKLSDKTIITSDNPRTEDPLKICHDVLKGCENQSEVEIEPDREKAIERALSCLEEGDILLVAGRGHEKFQIIGKEKRPFLDAKVIRETIEKLGVQT